MNVRSVEEIALKGKRVFLRLDLNVPIANGKVSDETRILAALPTLKYLLAQGSRLIVASHLGRPEKGGNRKEFSLEPVAEALSRLLSVEVILIEDPSSEAPRGLTSSLSDKKIILLENLRFDPRETENSPELASRFASYSDVYINDAFGSSHRAHASIVGLPRLVSEVGVGYLMKKEIEALGSLMEKPNRPFAVVMGGAKVSDKIGLIENLLDKVDLFIVGGAMSYSFLSAMGVQVGSSRVEKEKIGFCRELLERAKTRGKKVLLPVDHLVVPSIDRASEARVTMGQVIDDGWMGVDIGPKTRVEYAQAIKASKTCFWNGPMGIFEKPEFAEGTFAIAKALTEFGGTSVVGGGDSAAAAVASGYAEKMSHISTGGGASLEFLQGEVLPGLKVLERAGA